MHKLTNLAIASFLALPVSAQAACQKTEHAPVDLDIYYADAEGKSGDVLRAALNKIVRGHKAYSYTPCVWEILAEADEDPNNSSNIIGFLQTVPFPRVGVIEAVATVTHGIGSTRGPNQKAFAVRDNMPIPMRTISAQPTNQ